MHNNMYEIGMSAIMKYDTCSSELKFDLFSKQKL